MYRIKNIYRLDSTPFIGWLEERIEYYGGVKAYAEEIGEDYIWVTRLVGRKYKTVSLDKVDEVLCKDGTTHLRELYPELYEEYDF